MTLLRDSPFLCAVAASLIAVALQLSSGFFDPLALAIVTAATALAVAAAIVRREGREFPVAAALGAGVVHGLWCHLFLVPTFDAAPTAFAGFRALALLAAVFVSAYLCIHLRASLRALRFWGALAIFAAMAAAVVHASPSPGAGAFAMRSAAAGALLEGRSPFGARAAFPPLIAQIDAAAFGNPRLVTVVAVLVAAWAIARLGEGLAGEVAAMLVLFQGRTFLVVEQAFPAPITLATWAITALLISRRRRWSEIGLAMGACAASQLSSPILLLPLVAVAPWRATALAAGIAALTVLPFAGDAGALWRSVALASSVHTDSLSFLALWARSHNVGAWSSIPGLVAAVAVLGVCLRRPSVRSAAAGSAAAWLVFLLLDKQAFCNDEWLGGGLLCAAAATWTRKEVQ